MDIEVHIAPMQGFTQAPWRYFRREVYGGVWPEYTPFIRMERGEVRRHDMRDFTSELNDGSKITPQVIFGNMGELTKLCRALADNGAVRIDLNCGCPHPLQTGHGRGAAVIANPGLLRDVAAFLKEMPEIEFSLKMRLGMNEPDEWTEVMDIINDMPLGHLTVHPRTARQQYKGELHMAQFGRLLERCDHPVVFNGDILTPADVASVTERFPSLVGVMIGRGLCARPSMLTELAQGREWSREEQLAKLLDFHDRLLGYYREHLCGDAQVLGHIRNFWAYSENVVGRKLWKNLVKAGSMTHYNAAVSALRGI